MKKNIFIMCLVSITSSSFATTANPLFLEKLKNPKTYSAVKSYQNLKISKTICGLKNDMQNINDYAGNLGQSISFVNKFKNQVGAMTNQKSQSVDGKYCSGTLIGPNLFLTASHCIGNDTTSHFVAFNYETVKGQSQRLNKQEFFRITKVVEDRKSGLDFAIIQLEGTPGLKYGYTKVRSTSVDKNHLLTIIQHPSGLPKKVEIGHMTAVNGAYMEYNDLDTEPGSSGSGIIDKDGFLVGVHTNGGCGTSSSPSAQGNAGVRMSLIATASTIL